MDESLSLAHELLESLISEVVTVSQWDAATIARTRSQEGTKGDLKEQLLLRSTLALLVTLVCFAVRSRASSSRGWPA